MMLPGPETLIRLCDRYGVYFVYFNDSLTLEGRAENLSKLLDRDISEGARLLEVFPELVGRENVLDDIIDGRGELSIFNIIAANGAVYYNLLVIPDPSRQRSALLIIHDVTAELKARQLLQQSRNEVSLLSETLRHRDDNLKALNETTLLYINKLHATEESLKKSREELRQSNERMSRELLMAEKVQRQLVEFDPPDVPWLRTEYTYRPLEEVGGDFMGLMKRPGEEFAVFIGDVTGHGVAAALFIALLKSTFRQVFMKHGGTPDVMLEKINSMLLNNLNGNFVTCVYGLLSKKDDGSADFVFASGGHTEPVIVRANGPVEFLQSRGTMLGYMSPMGSSLETANLRPGDRLFLYTDGLPETENPRGKIIGFEEGLEELFEFSRSDTLKEAHGRIIEYCDRFREGEPLHDDLTILSFEIVNTP